MNISFNRNRNVIHVPYLFICCQRSQKRDYHFHRNSRINSTHCQYIDVHSTMAFSCIQQNITISTNGYAMHKKNTGWILINKQFPSTSETKIVSKRKKGFCFCTLNLRLITRFIDQAASLYLPQRRRFPLKSSV